MAERPRVPPLEGHEHEHEDNTPDRAAVKAVASFNKAQGIKYSKTQLFKHFNVPTRTGWRLLSANPSRLTPGQKDPRGRKSKITNAQIIGMHELLQSEGFDARSWNWQQLGQAVGLEASGHTIQHAIGSMDYHHCTSCQSMWVSEIISRDRVSFARFMLERYPEPNDWYRHRFSGEVHFVWEPQGKIRILKRPGERLCPTCLQENLQENLQPNERDKPRLHCWAAVGHNFKSEIVFYEIPGKRNGKMSLQVYKDSILDPIVRPWIERGDDFCLEEDDDPAHGTGKSNFVRSWKEQHHLAYLFNSAQSPDLSPIENCWSVLEDHFRESPVIDNESAKVLIRDGWSRVSQDFINGQVDTMPRRLNDVISVGGKLTAY